MIIMTEASSPQGRFWLKISLAAGLIIMVLALSGWWLATAAFWERVGWRLVAAVQDRLQAELTVGQVSGNLISGMVFREVTLQREGKTLLSAQELEISVSLLSFLKLEPVIRTLIIRRPVLSLQQSPTGEWNVANLLKKRPPPPFSRLHLRHIEIQDGTVLLDRPGRQLTCRDLNITFDVTVQDPGRPQLKLVVHEGALAFVVPPYPAVRLELALTASAQELLLHRAELSLADLPKLQMQGSATKLTEDPHLALSLSIPAISGTQLHQLWPMWPEAVPSRADLVATGPLSELAVSAAGVLHDCRWQAQGSWHKENGSESRFQLYIGFADLKPGVVPAWRQKLSLLADLSPLHGSLMLRGRGQPWLPSSLEARLNLERFTARQLAVTAADLRAMSNGPREQELQLNLQGNFGRIEASAGGQLWPRPGGQPAVAAAVRVATVGLNPEPLLAAMGAKAPPGSLDMILTGQVQAPSPAAWRQAKVDGTLQASGRLQNQPVQEVFFQGRWEGGELRFDPARLRLGNLAATAQGRLSAAGVEAKLALTLAPPGPWPLLPPHFTGQGKAEATVQGPWQSLSYQLGFQGQGLSWRRLTLQTIQGRVAGTASRTDWSITSFDLQARGLTTAVGRFGQIGGSGRTQDGKLLFDLKAREAPGHGGELAGAAVWAAERVQVQISRLQWGPSAFLIAAAEPATMNIGPNHLEITPLRLRFRQAVLSLVGNLSPENLSGQVRLENLQFADLAGVVPQLSLFQGAIQAQVDLSGSGRAPVLKGQVQINPGSIGTFQFDSFQTNLNFQANLLSIDGQLLEKPTKGRLTWQGTAPLTLSLFPLAWQMPDQGLQMRVWTENLTLALFPQLIPSLSGGDGPMELKAQVSGSFRRPLYAGALRYGPGSLTIRESGAPFALDPGEIRLEGDRLIIGRLHFQSGEGRGEITGGARVPRFRLEDVNLTLTAANLLAIRRAGSWAVANGQATLTGSWPNFRTAGRLTVSPGQFRVGFFRAERNQDIIILPRVCRLPDPRTKDSGAAAVVRNFTMDLAIDVPGNVWLRDKEVNIEMVGQINVLRRLPGPKYLGGWVKAREGTFAINKKPFTVDRAMLIFPGAPHQPIRVEARASRQIDDYTLSVFATGPLDSLRTGLESKPPLPPRDQLSLLLFDHLADKMTREEYITVTQRAMGLFGSLTAQQLKTFLGDKLPLLGEVAPTTSQEALGVGKKLGRSLTVSYERKLNPLEGEDVNQIRLNYKIHKYFSAETQLGRKNPGGDLFFNIDF